MQLNYPSQVAQWPLPRDDLLGFTTLAQDGRGASGTIALPTTDSALSEGAANRQLLTQALVSASGMSSVAVQWLQQVHGSACVYATAATARHSPVADAVWTDQSGVALAIQSADCVPVLLAHERAQLIGAAHGGWRGLLGGVLETLIDALPVAANELQAWIGPCISVRHFEVNEDVWGPVYAQCPDAVQAHALEPTKRMVDLVALTRWRLQRCGVARVASVQQCTFADARYFSHRQTTVEQGPQATTGRMASVVMLTRGSG